MTRQPSINDHIIKEAPGAFHLNLHLRARPDGMRAAIEPELKQATCSRQATLHHELVGTGNHVDAVCLLKLLDDVTTKEVPSTSTKHNAGMKNVI